METIQPNAHVTLEYTLKDDVGNVLDGSALEDGEPIEYVHGYGMLVPGLEAALVGLKLGEEKKVVVSAEEGFGTHDEELVLEIDRSEFPEELNIGDEFIAESPDGDEVAMRVMEVRRDSVIADANHPLAGMRLHYSVKVTELREASEEEIEEAAREFEEAEAHGHVHGPDCDHDHEHGEGHDLGLVTLGKKPVPMKN